MRIGIDVGGTNTDAVLLDRRHILAWHKAPTSIDVGTGIVQAIQQVLSQGNVAPDRVDCVMIGTTQFTNAIVERRNLLRVGVIRIALPATSGLPPFVDWPADMADAVRATTCLVRGGYQYDGRIAAELDRAAIASAALEMRDRGITSVAISGVFSPINGDMETAAETIVRDLIPGVRVSLSHRIGRLGILERESAAIMNACLADLSARVVEAFSRALGQLGVVAPFFISQNDGTLMTAAQVERYPVLTFASGPTNSMRGAAFLSQHTEALVADIGGTTTDIGALSKGFPRESSVHADIGGVRTNFRKPDLLSLPLGGGSIVAGLETGIPRIGPRSVGHRLREQALVFGGSTLTATDLAVAAGHADIGDRSRVAHLPSALVRAGIAELHRSLTIGVDRMKTRRGDVPLILVGGGSMLVSQPIAGTSEIVIPPHASVANAIGAAIAQAGGEIDRVFSYGAIGRDAALTEARSEAIAAAVAAGAEPGTVEVVDIEEVPLLYVPGGAVRVRARAVGDLAFGRARPQAPACVSNVS